MDVNKIPIIGKFNRNLTMLTLNFSLLGIVCLVLGVLIPFYPEVLNVLASALLVLAALLLFSTAYHIHSSKKKYFKFFGDK